MKENGAHNTKVTNIQLEVKENSAHSTIVTNIQLHVKENSAHSTEINIQLEEKKTVRITLK